jgi:hypothetical protein
MKGIITLALVSIAIAANAAPNVSYTVSGTSGDYTLDFSVQNTLNPSDMDIYFFGVELSGQGVVGSPASFNSSVWPAWNNVAEGGSSNVYNNNWIDFSYSSLMPGSTLSGFQVHVTDLVAPTSVNWFAYGYGFGDSYQGSDHFNGSWNPGFEGTATQAMATPEPAPMAALGLGVLGFVARRKKK